MRRYRKASGRPVPASRLARAKRGGIAMGMMAQSGRKSFRNQVTGGNDPIGPVANTAGCTMSSAENFNPSATQENGSCMWLTRHNGQWVTVGCNAWNPVTGYYDMGLGSIGTIKQCRFVNYGCLDPSADNYNPSADQDWTSGGTTLCVYGGSVGTLTGTKDPKKGMRSATGGRFTSHWGGLKIR